MSIHLWLQGQHKTGMKVLSLWHLSSPSPNLLFHSPLTHPPILHLGNAAGDSKYQDTAQALFYQGPQHLF